MTRFLKRYERFVELIAAHPDQAVVPTLDIDLAWHTHQLSPQAYFQFSVKKTGAFTDHNDRVDEDKLGSAFEWTSKAYHERYGEVYSECTCWYCECKSQSPTILCNSSQRSVPFSILTCCLSN